MQYEGGCVHGWLHDLFELWGVEVRVRVACAEREDKRGCRLVAFFVWVDAYLKVDNLCLWNVFKFEGARLCLIFLQVWEEKNSVE